MLPGSGLVRQVVTFGRVLREAGLDEATIDAMIAGGAAKAHPLGGGQHIETNDQLMGELGADAAA